MHIVLFERCPRRCAKLSIALASVTLPQVLSHPEIGEPASPDVLGSKP